MLDKIIEISTNEGDSVLDPFCGRGTTLVSASMLGRQYIGIDINPDAIEICRERLERPYKTTSTLLRVGADAYKTKTELELSILQQFECDIVQRNKGIDAFLERHYYGKPVAIKIQKDTESFSDAVNLLKKATTSKKCSFTVLITTEKNWEDMCISILDNMIVINSYPSAFERYILKADISLAL